MARRPDDLVVHDPYARKTTLCAVPHIDDAINQSPARQVNLRDDEVELDEIVKYIPPAEPLELKVQSTSEECQEVSALEECQEVSAIEECVQDCFIENIKEHQFQTPHIADEFIKMEPDRVKVPELESIEVELVSHGLVQVPAIEEIVKAPEPKFKEVDQVSHIPHIAYELKMQPYIEEQQFQAPHVAAEFIKMEPIVQRTINDIVQIRPLETPCIAHESTMQPMIASYDRDEARVQTVDIGQLMALDERDSGEKMMKLKKKNEDSINETIDSGEFKKISEVVTLSNLASCNTNILEKSLEVSYNLKCLATKNGPESGDIAGLANTVEKFAIELIEPLKSDSMMRAIFEKEGFKKIAETIVHDGHKKFVSHPVVYNLLMKSWAGRSYKYRYQKANCGGWYIWYLLNIWTVLDIVFFPIVFLLLFLIHKVSEAITNRLDHCVVVLFDCTWRDFYFDKMCTFSSRIIDNCEKYHIKIASIMRRQNGVVSNCFMERMEAKEMINSRTVRMTTDKNTLDECLTKAREMLKKHPGSNVRKTLLFFTDNKCGDSSLKEIERIKNLGCKVICVGMGVQPDIQELETMATKENAFLYHGNFKHDDVMVKTLQALRGEDMFDIYLEYFNTPYFIFVRDTLSYLVLLALHCVMCLQPSTIHFNQVEWIILLFFVGRFMMEVYQAVMEKEIRENDEEKLSSNLEDVNKKENKSVNRSKPSSDPLDPETVEFMPKVEEVQKGKIVFCPKTRSKISALFKKVLGKLSGYCSDWWNGLDLATLLVYTVILIMRSITWAEHSFVTNNRLLAISNYFYGLNTMFLTLRVFGHIMESKKQTGSIQIALFQIIGAVAAIFWQFVAAVFAFSFAITKIYMAEVSYSLPTNSSSHGTCENGEGLACWWHSTTHLIWSLLGISELDPLKSNDGASDALAKLLYGVFLVMGVVMMMNMMIALLSNTYQKVEDNAFYEWSYRKATTIRTYMYYHPVPVPFNIVSMPCLLIWKILLYIKRRVFCCKRSAPAGACQIEDHPMGNGVKDESGSMFDRLVLDLQATYFATHGYNFPMEESEKVDLMLKETEGNRQLIGCIAGQVFKYTKKEEKMLKKHIGSRSSIWDTYGISVHGHQLTYCPCSCGKCTISLEKEPKHHGAQFKIPISKEWPGFEVLITDIGDLHMIAVGVVSHEYQGHKFPGWEGNSVGYHLDDGKIFDQSCPTYGRTRDSEVPMAQRGDLVGCRVLFEEHDASKGTIPVSFTLNGRNAGKGFVRLKRENNGYTEYFDNSFFPFIGIGSEGVALFFKLVSREDLSIKRVDSEESMDRIERSYYSSSTQYLQNLQKLEHDVSLMSRDIITIKKTLEALMEKMNEKQATSKD